MAMRKVLIACCWIAALAGPSACALRPMSASEPMGWNYFFDGQEAKLAWGMPNSDAVGLMLTCAPHSRSVLVSGDAEPGQPHLILASDRTVSRLSGGAQADPLSGSTLVEARTGLGDPALAAFARSGHLTQRAGLHAAAMNATPKDRDAVSRFFQACA